MSDARTHNGVSVVDRVYDTLERGAELVGAFLGVDVRDEVSAEIEHRKAINASAPPAIAPGRERSRFMLPLPEREPFRIIEAIDTTTGKTVWTVTNGCESADCPSAEFAQQVLEALRAKGAR